MSKWLALWSQCRSFFSRHKTDGRSNKKEKRRGEAGFEGYEETFNTRTLWNTPELQSCKGSNGEAVQVTVNLNGVDHQALKLPTSLVNKIYEVAGFPTTSSTEL